jgi:hypothetical protein
VKVIGCSKGWFFQQRRFIGYLDRDVASAIIRGGLWGTVIPRFLKIYIGDTGSIEVLFQIFGPQRTTTHGSPSSMLMRIAMMRPGDSESPWPQHKDTSRHRRQTAPAQPCHPR